MAKERRRQIPKLWEEASDLQNDTDDLKKLSIQLKPIAYNNKISKFQIADNLILGGQPSTGNIRTGSQIFEDMPFTRVAFTHVVPIYRASPGTLSVAGITLASAFQFKYRWRKLGNNMRLDFEVRGFLNTPQNSRETVFFDLFVYFSNPGVNHEIQQPKE